MKTITQKLNITNEQRESNLFGLYLRWCESVTTNHNDFQAVLANAAINAWFLTELKKLEAEFQLRTNRYENSQTVSVEDLKICYIECTQQMFNIRPMALLEAVKIKPSKKAKGVPAFNQLLHN